MRNEVSAFALEVFLGGECVDLCLPSEDFARNSNWYNWFNDRKVTRFLEQGFFPNTPAQQVEFFRTLQTQGRMSLIISDKKQYVGTISLSSVNLDKRTADIALLFGEKSESEYSDLLALESMALVTEHAFDVMGLVRISAGQHEKLLKWQRRMETIGYRLEGIKTNGFIKGTEKADSVIIAVTAADYEYLKKKRGKLWDSVVKMKKRVESLPATSFAQQMKDFIANSGGEYYGKVFDL